MMTGADAGPTVDDLQFDRVFADDETPRGGATLACARCQARITGRYFQVGQAVACEPCKDMVQREQGETAARGRGAGRFLRAAGLGFAAAVVGAAIYYAVIAITNWELALVALLIGYMVGWSVRRGSGGGGGRRYQILALALTYFSVGLAYTPMAFKTLLAQREKAAVAVPAAATNAARTPSARVAAPAAGRSPLSASASAPVATPSPAGASGAPSAASSPPAGAASAHSAAPAAKAGTGGGGAADAKPVTAVALLVVLAMTIIFALVLPIVAVASTLPSGLLSAVIIGVGMQQAWKLAAAKPIPISGPYELGARNGVGQPEE